MSALYAQTDVSPDYMQMLEDDMQKYTKIATDTKQNVDYMPYVISVITADEFQKLGVLNLREALSLVPGVDLSIGMAGVKNPIFRGSNPYAMGQSKLIIDGVVVNDQLFGAYNQYLDMPLDIVERIEVVRGPGSLMSHVNAYAGSIHVITKANKNDGTETEKKIFAAVGSNAYGMGGFVSAYAADDVELKTDLFYQRHDQELPAGPDRFGTSQNAPLWLKNYALGINGSYKDFSFKGRFNKNESGVSYGQSFSLSNDTSDYLDVTNNFLEAAYHFSPTSDIKAEIAVGYFDEWRELQNKVMPNGSTMMGMGVLANGMYFLVDYSEQTYYERLDFKISTFDHHAITAGMTLNQSSVKDNTAKTSTNNLQTFTSKKLVSNTGREHNSFYLDDLIDINENVSVQLGAKFDTYNDLKDQFSPRMALVYRQDDENIYKLMYTRSYREPSWREKYLEGAHYYSADANVTSESVEAYEAAYIRKFGMDTDLKLNFFYLNNKDQIHAQNAAKTFKNSGDNELYGAETEFTTSIMGHDKLYANYSYVHGNNVSGSLANSAQHMISAYYLYHLNDNLSLSSIVKYVGEKDRINIDPRTKSVNDYTTVDLSSVYTYRPYDMTVTMSVKNILDRTYYLPSPENTYSGDFQQEGRSFLIRLSKSF